MLGCWFQRQNRRIEDIPPSTAMTWPVIQGSCKSQSTDAATSSADPIRLSGCLSAASFCFSSLLSNRSARGVSTIDGATALTRMRGANSAASERVSPSTAPFALAMEA